MNNHQYEINIRTLEYKKVREFKDYSGKEYTEDVIGRNNPSIRFYIYLNVNKTDKTVCIITYHSESLLTIHFYHNIITRNLK